jgi:hypothetical protein
LSGSPRRLRLELSLKNAGAEIAEISGVRPINDYTPISKLPAV